MTPYRRIKPDPHFSLCIKLNCQLIKGLNKIPDTMNMLKENGGNPFQCIGTEDFLNRTLIVTKTNGTSQNKIY